ncbi:hypothetical protein PMAYCL1PPCAC_21751, partial [Pristionchus mayeri]
PVLHCFYETQKRRYKVYSFKSICTETVMFPALDIDCQRDVFSRLDQDDLDEIATLNTIQFKLSESVRAKAPKVKYDRLFIMKDYFTIFKEENAFVLYETIDGSVLFKIRKEKKMRKDMDNPDRIEPSLLKGVAALLARFEFKKVSCSQILIDANFLDFLSGLEFSAFSIWNCAFEESLKVEEKARFLSILANARRTFVLLSFFPQASFITESFLREYAQCSPLSELFASFSVDMSTYIRPNKSFTELLSRFGSITAEFLVIDTSWLLPAIIKRLRQHTPGTWRFLICGSIDRENLERNLESDVKHTCDENSHSYHFRISRAMASLRMRIEGSLWNASIGFS